MPRDADDAFVVVDDLPWPVPIGRTELDVLETFLGARLDELMRELAS